MDMFINIGFWVAVAVAGILLMVGAFIYQRIIIARGGASLTVQLALDALAYWVGLAIFTGERVAISAFDEAEAYIAGADKKAVADSLYDLLPPLIKIGNFIVSTDIVKRLVPREEFQRLVEDAYGKADSFFQANEKFLKDQIAALPLPGTVTVTTRNGGNSVSRTVVTSASGLSEIADFADAEPKG